MSATTKDYSKVRFWLRVVELLFSLVVFITACVFISDYATSNINFCLFVGLTSFLLCILFVYIAKKKSEDRGFLTIELGLTILYWIFWLSAAAASASTVSWVNSLPTFDNDCSSYIYGLWYCGATSQKGAVRACCAFAWLTWGAWTASLVLMIIEDVMGPKKLLSSKTAGAAPAGAAAAAAAAGAPAVTVEPVATADAAPKPAAMV